MTSTYLTKPALKSQGKAPPHIEKLNALERFVFNRLRKKLGKLREGHLTLIFNNHSYHFGESLAVSELCAVIQVHSKEFLHKVALGNSLGAAEAYMEGHWSSPDLLKVVRVMVKNLDLLNEIDGSDNFLRRLMNSGLSLLQLNSRKKSRENIAAHYDLSNELFSLFLDKSMMYSAAMFPNRESSLEEASYRKLKICCEKLQLQSSDHLLEIGSGWGEMAIYAAEHYGCRVTTTTLSAEQYKIAKQKIRAKGLENRVAVLLKDYRDLKGSYDKLISIEMIEAVGHQYFNTYFAKCNSLLRDDGLMLIQAITIQDQRFEAYKNDVDFIRKYIFPGGCLPSNAVIAQCLRKNTNMQLVGFEDIGRDYARTLNLWRSRFFNNLDKVKKLGFDQRFIAMWDYYLCYCEGGFVERAISTAQFVFAKPLWRNH